MNKRKIFNLALAVLVSLALTGCVGDGLITSCSDYLQSFLDRVIEDTKTVQTERPEKLSLYFEQGNYLKAGGKSSKDCYAIVNDGKLNAADYYLNWYFDGVRSNYDGRTFTFLPSSEPSTVTVYVELSEVPFSAITEETESEILSATAQFVYYSSDAVRNAERTSGEDGTTFSIVDIGEDEHAAIEWFVDGARQAETSATFTFDPGIAGEYEISALVNGVGVNIADPAVSVAGTVTPYDIAIDYDSAFPRTTITWEGPSYCDYTVMVARFGRESEYAEYPANGNSITLTAEQFPITERSLSVSVRNDGNGGAIERSEYSDPEVCAKVNAEKAEYLSSSYGIANAYLSSRQEFFEQFDYMMLTREQPAEGEKTSMTRSFYLGFECNSASALVDDAFDASGYAGTYYLSQSLNRNILTVTIEFETVSVPDVSRMQNPPRSKYYYENLNGYDGYRSATGMSGETFPIDSREPIDVTTTDELFRLAELGYNPVPADSSGSAYEVYVAIRSALKELVDEGMSDYEKALAVYDWVMANNRYNNQVTSYTTAEAVLDPAFYMEGVVSYGYAVCDGIAKTFSYMCNACGVECLRVVGDAGEGGDLGGHAWNKVKVDDNWYIVDATWGDVVGSIQYSSGFSRNNIQRELGLHDYFLVTDADVATNHLEGPADYPATALTPYGHYFIQRINGVYDCYLNESDNELETAVKKLAEAIISDCKRNNGVMVGGKEVKSSFRLYEVKYARSNAAQVVAYFGNRYFKSYFSLSGVSYQLNAHDGVIVVIASGEVKLTDNALVLQ